MALSASRPLAACPHTKRSGSREIMWTYPSRMTGWSSTIKTRYGIAPIPSRYDGRRYRRRGGFQRRYLRC